MTDTQPSEMTSTEVAVITPTMTVERHAGNLKALQDEHYLARIPKLAIELAASNMVADAFKGKPEEIAIIGYGLADNGILLSISTLSQCYTVKGRPGYMAQIQIAMAALHGCIIRPRASKCNETTATVHVSLPDGFRDEVTFTMAEARRAKLHENPGGMYDKWPTNMLVARAVTRAISWYCPEVKLGLAGSVDLTEMAVLDARTGMIREVEENGEMIPVPHGKKMVLKEIIDRTPDLANPELIDQAKAMARMLWASHRLPEGQTLVPLSEVEGLIASIPDTSFSQSASPTPSGEAAPAETAHGLRQEGAAPTEKSPVEVVVPEVMFAPGTEPDYAEDEEPF